MYLLFKLFKIGYDKEGFDRFGYDREGYNKFGYDRNGNKKKIDSGITNTNSESDLEKSYANSEISYGKVPSVINNDYLEYDNNVVNLGYEGMKGIPAKVSSSIEFNTDSNLNNPSTAEKRIFEQATTEYEGDNLKGGNNIALCYLNGVGVTKDIDKALSILIDCAFQNSSTCLATLSDLYMEGIYVPKDIVLAKYFLDLSQNKNPIPLKQYKAMTPTSFKGKTKKDIDDFEMEERHLYKVVNYIRNRIEQMYSKFIPTDTSTSWMDRDQLESWRIDKASNRRKQLKINVQEEIMNNPYYARMDTDLSGETKTYYIGEEPYDYPNLSVVSVWSKFGSMYRQNNVKSFTFNEYSYKIKLRRRLHIQKSILKEIFDDFNEESDASLAQITDPYLIRILEEKKGIDKLTNIIRSIQLNQNQIIEYDFDKNFIVQGCAGSGKTMILLHRLANMQFNLSHFDPDKIKIITPSAQFNFFIDELSRNLKIDKIERMTVNEYYIYLLGKYRRRYTKNIKRVNKIVVGGVEHEYEELDKVETGPSQKDEIKTVRSDSEIDSKISSFIYSDTFSNLMKAKALDIQYNQSNDMDYGSVVVSCREIIESILKQFDLSLKRMDNYTCILHARLVFLLHYYGELRQSERLLCIDEGQDMSRNQYLVISEVNGGRTSFNIYGDYRQNIFNGRGLNEWKELSDKLDAKVFYLNENYRNSENIVEFYNSKLNFSNRSFGLTTKPVESINITKLGDYLKMQLILKNRTAIITNNPHELSEEVMNLCTFEIGDNKKVTLLNVIETKGLEFDSVFVIEDGMDNNQRYISYTRALSELYIVNADPTIN